MLIKDKHQESAVRNLINPPRKISVLTGGPGRGKTTMLKQILEALQGTNKSMFGMNVLLCCPTGKGAKQMQAAIPHSEPMTIHRMLGCQGPGEWTYNENNRIFGVDCVVCDEASMVGSRLLSRIIDGIDEKAKIILVGDADQLPPVPAGSPFHDICARIKDPRVVNRLIVNFRQAEGSLIADAADKILNKKSIKFGIPGQHALGGSREDDLFFREIEDKELIPDEVFQLCKGWAAKGEDYQILSPQHSGIAGVENLNKYLQEKLNPASPKKRQKKVSAFLTLRTGDKVINKKNNYKLGIFNGFVGHIVRIDSEGILIDFDGEKVMIEEQADLRQIKLAYCLTIHASQGSEYQNGVVICHSSHYFMLSNSLIYVAVSRFKNKLYVVGNKKGLNRAIKNKKSNERQTYLSDVL
ncbi:MAG: AAA family ATPase [Desulfosarcina sp.]|nr:AAA family ATPase [Desulfobacterales bacterium]